MSTVEKLELKNGVQLGETLRYEDSGYELTKEEARTVFLGTVEKIVCHCCVPNCGRKVISGTHNEEYKVERTDTGAIFIGCVHFNASEVEAVKEWLEAGK